MRSRTGGGGAWQPDVGWHMRRFPRAILQDPAACLLSFCSRPALGASFGTL